jgi:hypothetical protein
MGSLLRVMARRPRVVNVESGARGQRSTRVSVLCGDARTLLGRAGSSRHFGSVPATERPSGDPEAIEFFLTEKEAQRALEGFLRDEPEWRGLLRVEPVEFEASVSPN